MHKILVTGGAGYIGSHTCVELINAGYEVLVLDNFCNSKPESLKRIQKITGQSLSYIDLDVRDKDGLRALFRQHEFYAVIHFAGLKAVGESVQNPLRYYDNNVGGSVILTEVMTEFGVKKLVFSSSATVYGTPATLPIREHFPLSPANPYGRSKLMVEQILGDIAESEDGWNIWILRYFNPVGAHPSGLIGEDPNGIPNNLMPFVTQVAVGNLDELKVFGDDYETVDGTGVRDYIHVVDLALGHVAALQAMPRSKGKVTVNLGTGRGYSVLEVIRAFEEASQKKIPYKIEGRRSGDIAIYYADPSLAHDLLGWKASRGITEMCQDAWRWQSNNRAGYR